MRIQALLARRAATANTMGWPKLIANLKRRGRSDHGLVPSVEYAPLSESSRQVLDQVRDDPDDWGSAITVTECQRRHETGTRLVKQFGGQIGIEQLARPRPQKDGGK
jgi:hypothetical protein